MTKAELIEALASFPDDAEVYVWESYDAGYLTTAIDVNYDGDIIFEGR